MKEPNLIIENLKAILEECTASEDAVSYVNSEDAGTLKAAIEALEKQERDRWIPCKERLPEKEGCYLVAVKNDHERMYFKTAWFCQGAWSMARQKVLAWRPLPEPYTEEEA